MKMNWKKIIPWFLLVGLTLALLSIYQVQDRKPDIREISFSDFLNQLTAGNIHDVTISGNEMEGHFKDNNRVFETYTPDDPNLVPKLEEKSVQINVKPRGETSFWMNVLVNVLPILLFFAVWFWVSRSMGRGGAGGAMGFGKSKAKLLNESKTKITFEDVAGVDEAKEDLQEVVDFLKDPHKFERLGGKIPRGVLLVGPPGTGKAQPLDAKIKVPGGWVKMGDIKLGDMVSTPDNKTAKVIGLFPQGDKEIFKIEFDDGSYTECCKEHLWEIYCKDWKHLPNRSKVMSLSEIIEWKNNTNYKPKIKLVKPLDNPKIDLPIDPYLLGLYLGDGTSTTRSIGFSTKDEFILNEIQSVLKEGYELNHVKFYDHRIEINPDLRKTMRIGYGEHGNYLNYYTNVIYDLGLLGKKSDEKFIPELYFNAAIEDRLALVQGLMDSDGTAERTGSAFFSTTSYELADGLRNLIWSLGGKCKIHGPTKKTYTYRGVQKQGKDVYNLWVRLGDNSDLFRLPRKKRLASKLSSHQYFFGREIVNIQSVGFKPAQCILIDHPDHLYVTDDYVVTHNTLLARAIAGEAGVPFFSISGSDFVEMFVGVGASRVRDMFEQAKKNAPCIIFCDEIDAVGRNRGVGLGGGNDEREQTLNQLLVEMDGFEPNEGIILIAATNRADVLDPALLRPGRFDRQIQVPNPDFIGREKILKVHSRKVPLAPDVDLKVVARGTPGFSGADLMNLVNEAALLAARRSKRIVTKQEFEDARDKILMGAERRTLSMTEEEKSLTAYHEGGHALVSLNTPASTPIHKATIIPRGRALGMVQSLPERDEISQTYEQMTSMLAMAMGGRVAEELVFGESKVTSGAASDIQQCTKIARAMVTQLGFSSKLGTVAYADLSNDPYAFAKPKTISEETQQIIDSEVKRLVQEGYDTAKRILTEKRHDLETLAKALLEFETLTGEEIKNLLKGKRPVRDGVVDDKPKHNLTDDDRKELVADGEVSYNGA